MSQARGGACREELGQVTLGFLRRHCPGPGSEQEVGSVSGRAVQAPECSRLPPDARLGRCWLSLPGIPSVSGPEAEREQVA